MLVDGLRIWLSTVLFLSNIKLFNKICLLACYNFIWLSCCIKQELPYCIWTALTFFESLHQLDKQYLKGIYSEVLFVWMDRKTSYKTDKGRTEAYLSLWDIVYLDVERKIPLKQCVSSLLHGYPFPCFQKINYIKLLLMT